MANQRQCQSQVVSVKRPKPGSVQIILDNGLEIRHNWDDLVEVRPGDRVRVEEEGNGFMISYGYQLMNFFRVPNSEVIWPESVAKKAS